MLNMAHRTQPSSHVNPDKFITSTEINSPDLKRSWRIADLCLPLASLQTQPKRSSAPARLLSVSDRTPGCNAHFQRAAGHLSSGSPPHQTQGAAFFSSFPQSSLPLPLAPFSPPFSPCSCPPSLSLVSLSVSPCLCFCPHSLYVPLPASSTNPVSHLCLPPPIQFFFTIPLFPFSFPFHSFPFCFYPATPCFCFSSWPLAFEISDPGPLPSFWEALYSFPPTCR